MQGRKWLVGLIAVAALFAAAPASASAPYSSHSQLYACCTDSATKEAMFLHAKESGASFIRVDVAMESVFPQFGPPGSRDWTGVDEVAELSERYGLPVLAVLQGTPRQDSACQQDPWFEQRLCPPVDPLGWGEQAAEVAARYVGRIDHFQIWNEPDGAWAFRGGPEDYARILAAAYDAIKREVPGASVVLGGIMNAGEGGRAWVTAAFSTPGVDAWWKFDIAAVHLRGPASGLAPTVQAWHEFMRRWSRPVPLWITEHGYSSDTAWQNDGAFMGGAEAQARYLSTTLPGLALAGAEQIFVTLRDGGGGAFDSEGIVQGTGLPGGTLVRKPAWYAVRDAALSWPPVVPPAPAPPPPAGPCAQLQGGSNEADLLQGTGDGDRLEGRRGADRLDGREADDCLNGGVGDDRLHGRLGDDELNSGPGADRLDGGDGNDRLAATGGNDRLWGGTGDDVLRGGSGRDAFDAGPGRDRIEAADGTSETVRCGSGHDTVRADRSDRLLGCERIRRG